MFHWVVSKDLSHAFEMTDDLLSFPAFQASP